MNVIHLPDKNQINARLAYKDNRGLTSLLEWLHICISNKCHDDEIMVLIRSIELTSEEDIQTASDFVIDAICEFMFIGFEPTPSIKSTPGNNEFQLPESVSKAAETLYEAMNEVASFHLESAAHLGVEPTIIENGALIYDASLWPVCSRPESFYSDNPLIIMQNVILELFPVSSKNHLASGEKVELEIVFQSVLELASKVKESPVVRSIDSLLNSYDKMDLFDIWSRNIKPPSRFFSQNVMQTWLGSVFNGKADDESAKALLAVIPRLEGIVVNDTDLGKDPFWDNFFEDDNIHKYLLSTANNYKNDDEIINLALGLYCSSGLNLPWPSKAQSKQLSEILKASKSASGTYSFPFEYLWHWSRFIYDDIDSLEQNLSKFLSDAYDDYDRDDYEVHSFNAAGIHLMKLANTEQLPELAEAVLLTILLRSIWNNKHLEPWPEISITFRQTIKNSNPDFLSYLLEVCVGIQSWWNLKERDPLIAKKIQRIIWMVEQNSHSEISSKVSTIHDLLENKAIISRKEAHEYVCSFLGKETFIRLSDKQKDLLIDAEVQYRKSQRQDPEKVEKEYWNEIANAPFLVLEDMMRTALIDSHADKYSKPPELGRMLFSTQIAKSSKPKKNMDFEIKLGKDLLAIFDCFDDKKMTNKLIELNKKFRNFASHDAFPLKELRAWRELLYNDGFLRDLISRLIPYEKRRM